MKKQYYIFIFFIFILGLNACSDNPSQATINLTTEIQTEQETENQTTNSPTTNPTITTNNHTTVTEVPTDLPTDNITTDMPTTQATTNTTTTIPTTEAPTTIPTTEEPTTILVIEITLDDGLGGTYDILSGSPGDTIILPSNPTRINYIFDGWYVDQAYTIPFEANIFPSSYITIYAKWMVDPAKLIMDALEAHKDLNFVCNDNVCTNQENSLLTYRFNFNNLTFEVEHIDDDTSEDSQTRHEIVIIDEDWNFTYSLLIENLSGTPKSISGSGQIDNYDINDFSSNPSSYLTENDVYDDVVQFINQAVAMLEFIVADLEIDYNELN